MDQLKIGKFIAERRKQNALTQMQLAEMLGITDKAISKWERGISMPDSSIMLDLCDILHITVNELLSGEEIIMEKECKKNEQILIEMAKELEKKNKTIWFSMWLIITISTTALLAGTFIATILIPDGVFQVIAILGLCFLFFITCLYVLKLEISVGAYKCKSCGHEIVPTFSEVIWTLHSGTTRYLKCPKCHKRTWCKKILKK